MNFSFYIAKRYLLAKKSHNAINIISWVAVCGVSIATLAMICALSVFNGFEDLVASMFSTLDPELKITPSRGKVFDTEDEGIMAVKKMPEIILFTEVVEDHVLVKYQDRQVPATIKGVSDNFAALTEIEASLMDGDFLLREGDVEFGVLGIGLASRLGTNSGFVRPLEIYAPKRKHRINMANPGASFSSEEVFVGGVFCINQPIYDENLLIVSLAVAKSLLDYDEEASALEIKLVKGADVAAVQKNIESILGSNFIVKNRYQQQETSFRMMSIEKWITFLILSFILVIAMFNGIGSLTMLMIEKREDVLTLKKLGANDETIKRIFLFEGWMISLIGAFIGISLGLILCFIQQHFGIIKMGSIEGAFVVDAYPVKVAFLDAIFTFLLVSTLGFITALYPVRHLNSKN